MRGDGSTHSCSEKGDSKTRFVSVEETEEYIANSGKESPKCDGNASLLKPVREVRHNQQADISCAIYWCCHQVGRNCMISQVPYDGGEENREYCEG